ncbi:MAG: hypothetical protein JRN11_06505 [Nitrososphaerota archaeon]|nr:hypothetical protein [Nitrososphaerota archaeon]MDG7026381.1 hypothetical protein [Nitrososphaerota archaeon]
MNRGDEAQGGGPGARCGLTCPRCGTPCERQHAPETAVVGRKLNHYHITPYPYYEKHEWRA